MPGGTEARGVTARGRRPYRRGRGAHSADGLRYTPTPRSARSASRGQCKRTRAKAVNTSPEPCIRKAGDLTCHQSRPRETCGGSVPRAYAGSPPAPGTAIRRGCPLSLQEGSMTQKRYELDTRVLTVFFLVAMPFVAFGSFLIVNMARGQLKESIGESLEQRALTTKLSLER